MRQLSLVTINGCLGMATIVRESISILCINSDANFIRKFWDDDAVSSNRPATHVSPWNSKGSTSHDD